MALDEFLVDCDFNPSVHAQTNGNIHNIQYTITVQGQHNWDGPNFRPMYSHIKQFQCYYGESTTQLIIVRSPKTITTVF